ncbi:type II secretion system GspH family protein [Salinibacterium sp. SYSU T00001]|uniref:PulJ/GspJ family protein n=1 Tax=Homoserinimonas sedimenticola TaxID=2986805 RepID=UPI0022368920|nr:type II secretion system protein [Salinibacterium sedimenticola]MCW4385332.1 type II secretion system GspH family protein [Salinibacterium sedimenticola]
MRGGSGEAGFSLPELIVAMFLFSIVSTLAVTLVVTVSQAFMRERAATDSTNVAAVGMNEVTRIIRAGTLVPQASGNDLPVFAEAKKESVTLHAYIDTSSSTPRPLRVRFAIDPATRDLVETRWLSTPHPTVPGAWVFNSTPDSSRVIARKIVVPAGGEASLFTYYRIVAGEPQEISIGSGGVSSSLFGEIAVVEVRMKVQADITERADPVTITNRVGLPNLGISRLEL